MLPVLARACDGAGRGIAHLGFEPGYHDLELPVGACLEDTMSASGDLPSIGAPTVGRKSPHRS